ncbi:AsmA family protein [Shewanella inventionis]|uniref:Cell envelope biogenesis protein AsmA n=1 Tax=Shewanella inventionis TaxID=1738770 RepID=A0ABQ1IPG3_9GAMM|nr:AsmA family protein [Shewanella inventionis]MCL1157204.1 AsmA family protein [Shewanella inventionis]UAL41938.1 AsmA family protein [Shewanella inventionis]GGB49049.1 cell envelope biogenesis protein AsmA [Shewanella inventionis]
MKLVKWLLAIMLTLVVGITVYLTMFFDLNNFKPQIVDAVKKQTGRDLQITDDLSWSVFPSLGIKLGGISLSNPENFTPASMLDVNEAVANVALMPLFSQQIEVELLKLDGLTLNLVTQKNGETSFDGLTGEGASNTQAPSASKDTKAAMSLQTLDIGGVALTNTNINLIDMATNTTQTFSLKSFTLGEFSLGKLADFAYEFSAALPDMAVTSSGKGQLKIDQALKQVTINDFIMSHKAQGDSLPNQLVTADMTTQVVMALDAKTIELQLTKLSAMDIAATGNIKVNYANSIPKIVMSLDAGDIDVDALFPPQENQAETSSTDSEAAQGVEPDLSVFNTIDANVKLSAKSIKVSNLLTQNWQLNMAINKGVLTLSSLTADLYEGKLALTAKLDGRKAVPTYQFEKVLTGVNIRPLLKDAAEVDLLSGKASFQVKGNGFSLIPEKLKQNLDAAGQFEVSDGSLYGVNIPQMIRSAQQKLQGDLSADNKEELKTDFTSLTGSFSIKDAVVTNPDLAMASPLIRLKGNGLANIATETLDYSLTTSVVGSLVGQGEGVDESLKGVDIPVTIKGTFQDPKFGIDTKALLEGQFKDEADKAKEKLKEGLFKKLGI